MNTLTQTNDELAPLILAGDGYQLTIAPEAEARKFELIAKASLVRGVTSNDDSADAQVVTRSLAAMRIEVEKCRKIVVEPVNAIVKKINSTAADFIAEVTAEENRIKKLVGDHAMEQAKLKAAKEAEERRAFEEARQAREDALAKQEAAEAVKAGGGIAALLAAKEAAKQAEAARVETLAARMDASAEVAGTKVAEGVRFAWDFEIVAIQQLAEWRCDLVTIEPKRAAILEWIKRLEADGVEVNKATEKLGVRSFKKPVVSSR